MKFYGKVENTGGEFVGRFIDELMKHEGKDVEISISVEKKQRTITQNRALHKLYDIIAETLNDAGLDMKKFLKEEVDIPWTKETVKNNLWRPIQVALTGKESTKDLERSEVNEVYNVLNRELAKKGIHEEFPSIQTIMMKQRGWTIS